MCSTNAVFENRNVNTPLNWNTSKFSQEWLNLWDALPSDWMESVQLVFDYFCERTPRSFVESRETSVVWNYKYADLEFGRVQVGGTGRLCSLSVRCIHQQARAEAVVLGIWPVHIWIWTLIWIGYLARHVQRLMQCIGVLCNVLALHAAYERSTQRSLPAGPRPAAAPLDRPHQQRAR